MAKTCKYEKYQKYISYNDGATWMIVQNEYQRGKLLSSTSSDCGGGITEYRWVNLDPSQEYYCSGTTKYYKQQKQQSTDGQTWTNVVPAEYQWGTAYQFNSTDCGYVPPMYKWVLADISSDWVCDECDAEQHRWYATSAYCVNTDKWEHQVKQYKSGNTWMDVTPAQTQEILVEHNSSYCQAPTPTDYSKEYLTFVTQDSDVTFWTKEDGGSNKRYSYSLDSGATWAELPTYSGFTVSANHKVMWKGDTSGNTNVTYFASSGGTWVAEGNAMSLLYGDDFSGQTSMGNGNFGELFYNCSGLTNAENLILPATALTSGCYYRMFADCTSLTVAPSTLPATTLADNCYSVMFASCTSLTVAPELPATTLADNCYISMFAYCTSLTTAPSTLPATTLAEWCYSNMFYGCTSLVIAPQLPATTLGEWCYHEMFAYCTSLTTAPELPATTLLEGCYWYMFAYCRSLNSITCLATDITAYDCTTNWLRGVAASGTFTKAASMNDWPSGGSGIPAEGWTVTNYTN